MTTSLKADQDRNLVLIGYRATGKTAVGARLAQILNRPFVDLDQILVQEAGRAITEIVARHGWEDFRRREKELVARFGARSGQVLATGGGAVLDPENVRVLRDHGVVIWLTAAPEVIQSRLAQDQPVDDSRPSLTGGDTIREVEEVLKVRQPLYRAAAQITVETTGLTIPEVVDRVLAALQHQEEALIGR